MDSFKKTLSRTFSRAGRQIKEPEQPTRDDDEWQTVTAEAESWPIGDEEGEQAKWHNVTDEEATTAVNQEHDDEYFARITDTSKRGFVKEVVNEMVLGPAGGVVAKIGEMGQQLKELVVAKPLPTPEEIGCPCFNYPETGWRACDVHRLHKAKKLGLI
ncbi:hypothetical protein GTA08_BOTSDO05506 [Neofusicoccum parvum]|nr:hypothetical protein GTA08_BOTSDO05506 [Neofusicoccum parvum]